MIPTHTPDQAAAAVTQQAETIRREQEATVRRVEDLVARGGVCGFLRRDSGVGYGYGAQSSEGIVSGGLETMGDGDAAISEDAVAARSDQAIDRVGRLIGQNHSASLPCARGVRRGE